MKGIFIKESATNVVRMSFQCIRQINNLKSGVTIVGFRTIGEGKIMDLIMILQNHSLNNLKNYGSLYQKFRLFMLGVLEVIIQIFQPIIRIVTLLLNHRTMKTQFIHTGYKSVVMF